MATVRDVALADRRLVRTYDSAAPDGSGAPDALVILWHHGSPQTGALLDPLVAAAETRRIRMVSYGRPSYGGSSPNPGRNVASAAGDVAQIVDALGISRFAVMGHSGGGPHALACAALLSDRVIGAVCLAGIAPLTGTFDWYAGMASDGGLRSAAIGRAARQRYAASAEFDAAVFTPADWAALESTWASLGADSVRAGAAGPDGLIDDDLAFVTPWGFDVSEIGAPVLVVQGGEDRVVPPTHAEWLVRHCQTSEIWLRPRDGHISVLGALPLAMDWLQALQAAAR